MSGREKVTRVTLAGVCALLVFSTSTTAAVPGSVFSGLDWGDARVIEDNDRVADLSPHVNFITDIYRLDVAWLKSANQSLAANPWADRRWPMSSGTIGIRYADPYFMNLSVKEGSFQSLYDYTLNNSIAAAVANVGTDPSAVDRLSAAEKYDLLLGDLSGTLTRALWNEGQKFNNDKGISHWMGLCEGSAAAAMMSMEPRLPVTLRSLYNGITVKFNGLDIKALLALAWSSYGIEVPVVGGRCTLAINGAYDPNCYDTNPGTWHAAVLNLVGMRQGTLIFDRYPGAEVWNVPVLYYAFTYTNPVTGATSQDLASAMVRTGSYPTDPYRALRAPGTMQIVGVKMRVVAGERPATGVAFNGPVPMQNHNFDFDYDLEISATGQILGGEWHSGSARPDFLWAVTPGTKPVSIGDAMLRAPYMPGDQVPEAWRIPARRSAEKMQVLSAILDRLVALSAR